MRTVLYFLEDGTGTAVSDHLGLIIFTKTQKKITRRRASVAVWFPITRSKHCHHRVIVRECFYRFICDIIKENMFVMHTDIQTLTFQRDFPPNQIT